MESETRSPAREKYREAQFFCRKLERSDDGLGHVRSHTDKDEFRFYVSAFCSAVGDLHRQVGQAGEDDPAFESWVDDDDVRDLHAFFQDRCHDVVEVTTTRQASAGETDRIGTSTREPIASSALRYCLADDSSVPDELVPEDADRAPASDLARTYLDHLDSWLADRDARAEASDASSAE
jgi:hypothetical protein